MTLTITQVVVLAVVQGLTELLPVSSSAHVIIAEKLLGLDPASPGMTLLLVMLHAGTMLAVLIYFWREWRQMFFRDAATFKRLAFLVLLATALTAVVGEGLVILIERSLLRHGQPAEVEQLFGHLALIAAALFAVGLLIIVAGLRGRASATPNGPLNAPAVAAIGIVQGLAIPFRGFSRSGSTISAAMLAGVDVRTGEAFSFALAVVITPPVLAREVHRYLVAAPAGASPGPSSGIWMGVLGMLCALVAGVVALKWLSDWLHAGRWYLFGGYCIIAAGVVFALWRAGY